jgi:SAM-dependent methyltransferase
MNAQLKPAEYRELLIGCGNSNKKRIHFDKVPELFQDLTTMDISDCVGADVVHDLDVLPYPFADNTFDEIHAYEVLEHCGRQGDWKFFFAQFSEFYRILKPGGYLMGTVPMWDSPWAWGDPGHTRIISKQCLSYLDQQHYEQVGNNSSSDYRNVWKGNFECTGYQESAHQLGFVIRAMK